MYNDSAVGEREKSFFGKASYYFRFHKVTKERKKGEGGELNN